ncbi:MAG: hypothetical protein QM726_07905 [Chitinophagaceae bacterium]
MKTLINNANQTREDVHVTFNRSKAISVADVWNIQRHKRNRVQRRIAL